MQQDDVTLASDTLDRLQRVSTATITTQLFKTHGLRTRSIRGVTPVDPARARFVGPAYTLRYVPMREDLSLGGRRQLKENPAQTAIDAIPAGAVMVIDMNGDADVGALGDILIARLVVRGAAGVVADGGMRDIDPVRQMSLPVFCRGFGAPPSFASLLVADSQCAIGCGGVLVIPGDIVVADADGVVVIPRYLADQVARDGWEQEQMEAWVRRRVDAGAPVGEVYPPNERYMAEYKAWVAAGRPDGA
jgi:regulator of RNase E activity RraA